MAMHAFVLPSRGSRTALSCVTIPRLRNRPRRVAFTAKVLTEMQVEACHRFSVRLAREDALFEEQRIQCVELESGRWGFTQGSLVPEALNPKPKIATHGLTKKIECRFCCCDRHVGPQSAVGEAIFDLESGGRARN